MRLLRAQPMLIYGEDGVAGNIRCDDRWIFDTVILNHLGAQLRPHAIDVLCKESGLLLGHCYMGALQTKFTHNCLMESGGELEITPSFVTAIEYLGYRQREHDVVCLSFNDLRNSLVAFATTRLIRHEHGWSAKTSADEKCRMVVAGDREVIARTSCDSVHKRLDDCHGYVSLHHGKRLEIRLGSKSREHIPARSG